jgi:hypothetical protein
LIIGWAGMRKQVGRPQIPKKTRGTPEAGPSVAGPAQGHRKS